MGPPGLLSYPFLLLFLIFFLHAVSVCSLLTFVLFRWKPDYLTALFTPHVVMVTIVSVFVFVIVAIGLSYYCYRVRDSHLRRESRAAVQLRAENKIAPTDTGSVHENEKDEQVAK